MRGRANGNGALLDERTVPVFATVVRLREGYAAAYGEVPRALRDYGGVLDELLDGPS